MVLFDYLKENYGKETLINFVRMCLSEGQYDTNYEYSCNLEDWYGNDALKVLEDFGIDTKEYFKEDMYGKEFMTEDEVLEDMKVFEDDIETNIYNKENYLNYCIDILDMSDIDYLIHDINEFRFENMSKDELYKMLGLEMEDKYSKNQLYEMFMNYVEDDYEQ